ncbi:hypothetical protein Pyn_08791 [Prunus yedoensis var. nudiflora]|uniref:Uncharacterized protein n=1 Tax=Prunus yedoensis var. nudiflora TaxID=2094558 RepID=A0A314ZFY7_PRUYE|nr:hypothetical protein Pyn_08791 [Prunus yedoensis var. nudiflora]
MNSPCPEDSACQISHQAQKKIYPKAQGHGFTNCVPPAKESVVRNIQQLHGIHSMKHLAKSPEGSAPRKGGGNAGTIHKVSVFVYEFLQSRNCLGINKSSPKHYVAIKSVTKQQQLICRSKDLGSTIKEVPKCNKGPFPLLPRRVR